MIEEKSYGAPGTGSQLKGTVEIPIKIESSTTDTTCVKKQTRDSRNGEAQKVNPEMSKKDDKKKDLHTANVVYLEDDSGEGETIEEIPKLTRKLTYTIPLQVQNDHDNVATEAPKVKVFPPKSPKKISFSGEGEEGKQTKSPPSRDGEERKTFLNSMIGSKNNIEETEPEVNIISNKTD